MDRRELKIAIESLEHLVDKDRVAVADLEASYKELKEEVDKAEAARVAEEADDDRISVHVSPSIPDQDRPPLIDEVWPEEGERTFTKKEFDAEMLKRGVGTLSYQFEKLCQALAEGEEERRKAFEEDGGSSRRPPLASERKRILGTLPSFVTGTTDFQLHMEAFRDFCELNDLTDNPLKVKRLFLTSLDQTARLRCAGLEPDKPPCNTMSHIEYLNRLREMFVLIRIFLPLLLLSFSEGLAELLKLVGQRAYTSFQHLSLELLLGVGPFSLLRPLVGCCSTVQIIRYYRRGTRDMPLGLPSHFLRFCLVDLLL